MLPTVQKCVNTLLTQIPGGNAIIRRVKIVSTFSKSSPHSFTPLFPILLKAHFPFETVHFKVEDLFTDKISTGESFLKWVVHGKYEDGNFI